MTDVLVPTSDVNSETGVIVEWKAADGTTVAAGEIVAEIETSKAVLEVPSPSDGLLLHLFPEGAEVPLTLPVAKLFDDAASLGAYREAQKTAEAEAAAKAESEGARATHKAKARAEELGVDLASLSLDRLITVKDVEAAASAAATIDFTALPDPLEAPVGAERVLIIGGARGATQVIDIFRAGSAQTAVAILDDDATKWGQEVYGVPIVGGTDRIGPLFEGKKIDAAIIAISTSVAARTKFRKACQSIGVPLTNAIDGTAKIATEVTLGRGNVICAFVQIGTSAIVGDNNFISAYNSFEHHNVIGSDISTGPGCVTSSRVRIGDRCRLGTGIFIEPGVELGEEVRVASGAILVRSVPARHTVKTKIVTTTVVPNR